MPETGVVPPVSGVFSVAGKTTTLLSWISSSNKSFETIVARQLDRFPKNPLDGETVFRSNVVYYNDGGLASGKTYHYSIFQIGTDGEYSTPVFVKEAPREGLPEVPTPPLDGSTPPSQMRVSSFSFEADNKQAILRWKNPSDPHFLGVQIVRGSDSLPAHSFDGSVVFRGRSESFIDTGLASGKRYVYGIFPFDWSNAFYSGSFTSGTTENDFKLSLFSSFETQTTTASSEEGVSFSDIQLQVNAVYERIKEISLIIQNLLGQAPLPASSVEEEQKEKIRKSQTHIVRITESGFSPKTLTIRKGDIVEWVRVDAGHSWPASDVHPTHGSYPESGGCIGSIFDSCRTLSEGDEYFFLFNVVGVWQYHDHLHPLLTGTITVQ